jgi:hypothetical protein
VPSDRATATFEEERRSRAGRVAGSLACPECDAPVALAAPRMTPGEPLGCPFCGRAGAVRDFLTLGEPTRPARVVVHVAPVATR